MSNPNGITGASGSTVGANLDQKIDQLKERARGLADRSSEKVDQLKTKVVEVKERAKTRGGAMIDSTVDVIKAHPLKSVAIAFGIGYIGMRLMRRR